MTEQAQAGAGESQSTQAQQANQGQQQGAQQAAQNGQQQAAAQQSQQSGQQSQAAQQGQQQAPQGFPDHWRELMSGMEYKEGKWTGGDDKEYKRLQRFTGPDAVFKSSREMEKRFSSAKFKTDLPENATPEQLADYRRDNGIPETHDKYELKLSDGLVIGEEDKPVVDIFLKHMHAANSPAKDVSAAVNAYYQILGEQQAAEIAEARSAKLATQDELRGKWGADYRTNVNIMNATMAGMPEGLRDRFKAATLGDGSFAFNDVEFCEWFAGFCRELNPAGTVVPGGADSQLQTIETELKTMAAARQKDINAWQHPNNAATRARERELLGAQDKLKQRVA